jgi:hypothetical protein|tara:strand:- start:85 stop:408 length:324 start_codon:yes stop_codon:yes gene_type:complete
MSGSEDVAAPTTPEIEAETLSYAEMIPLAARQEVAIGGAWYRIRLERGEKLTATDWTQNPDNTITPEKKSEWSVYRQSLRDITTQTITVDDADIPNVSSITWPTPPQ